ncbi:hypothetical protein LJR030_002690 [Rhizobium sp. LjRoot30]
MVDKTVFAVPCHAAVQSVAGLKRRIVAETLLYMGLLGFLWQFGGLLA